MREALTRGRATWSPGTRSANDETDPPSAREEAHASNSKSRSCCCRVPGGQRPRNICVGVRAQGLRAHQDVRQRRPLHRPVLRLHGIPAGTDITYIIHRLERVGVPNDRGQERQHDRSLRLEPAGSRGPGQVHLWDRERTRLSQFDLAVDVSVTGDPASPLSVWHWDGTYWMGGGSSTWDASSGNRSPEASCHHFDRPTP